MHLELTYLESFFSRNKTILFFFVKTIDNPTLQHMIYNMFLVFAVADFFFLPINDHCCGEARKWRLKTCFLFFQLTSNLPCYFPNHEFWYERNCSWCLVANVMIFFGQRSNLFFVDSSSWSSSITSFRFFFCRAIWIYFKFLAPKA